MKKNRFKIGLILLLIGLSIWALYPTYQTNQLNDELANQKDSASEASWRAKNGQELRDASGKSIKLGLDLRGGMYATMEVDVLKFIEEQALQKDAIFTQVVEATRKQEITNDGSVVDLFVQNFQRIAQPKGKALANYFFFDEARTGADEEIVAALRAGSDEAVDRAIEIIRNRVDQYGLTEPTIQKQGSRRIIVEIPGAGDPAQIHQLLSGTAQLEFKRVKNDPGLTKVFERIDKVLAGDTSVKASTAEVTPITPDSTRTAETIAATDTTKADSASAVAAVTKNEDSARRADSAALAALPEAERIAKIRKDYPFTSWLQPSNYSHLTSEEGRNQLMVFLSRPDIKAIYQDVVSINFSRAQPGTDGNTYYEVYFLEPTPDLTGKVITDARADIDPTTGRPDVTMQMDEEGARTWRRVTRQNIGKQIAIVLDNVVYSAPEVKGEIPSGNSSISGSGDMAEARLLSVILKAGALPAPVKIVQEQIVGPSLGQDSIEKGTASIIWAFLAVMVFMALYYVMGGVVADIALLFNLLFTMAILATFGATLTLPGMAGLALTVGIAVDANVLIYERIREELERGKSLKLAIDDGYSRAFAPIFDGHLTALFSGVILYAFGTGAVQGFAVTLLIGIAASLFTAIVITRVIIDVMLEKAPNAVKFG